MSFNKAFVIFFLFFVSLSFLFNPLLAQEPLPDPGIEDELVAVSPNDQYEAYLRHRFRIVVIPGRPQGFLSLEKDILVIKETETKRELWTAPLFTGDNSADVNEVHFTPDSRHILVTYDSPEAPNQSLVVFQTEDGLKMGDLRDQVEILGFALDSFDNNSFTCTVLTSFYREPFPMTEQRRYVFGLPFKIGQWLAESNDENLILMLTKRLAFPDPQIVGGEPEFVEHWVILYDKSSNQMSEHLLRQIRNFGAADSEFINHIHSVSLTPDNKNFAVIGQFTISGIAGPLPFDQHLAFVVNASGQKVFDTREAIDGRLSISNFDLSLTNESLTLSYHPILPTMGFSFELGEEMTQTYEFSPIPKRGDANNDQIVDASDAIFILHFLFLGGTEPSCLDAADVNADNEIDVTDGIFLLVHLFLGGAPPSEEDIFCSPRPAAVAAKSIQNVAGPTVNRTVTQEQFEALGNLPGGKNWQQIILDGGFYQPPNAPAGMVAPGQVVLVNNLFQPKLNQDVIIHFHPVTAGQVTMKLYTLKGEFVKTLLDQDQPASATSTTWNGTNEHNEKVASGIYLLLAEGPGFKTTKKIAVVK